MKSVLSFNKDQLATFDHLTDEVGRPTSALFVLETLESVLFDQDNKSLIELQDDSVTDLDICLAALEYYRMAQSKAKA